MTPETALLGHIFEERILWDSTDALTFICHEVMESEGLSIDSPEGKEAADFVLTEFCELNGYTDAGDSYNAYCVYDFLGYYVPRPE